MVSSSSAVNLDELACSFMYSQFLKEVLLSMKYDQQAKRRFIDHLQTLYAANRPGFIAINEFEQTYNDYSPAW